MGLEPTRPLQAPEPKSGGSTNSPTSRSYVAPTGFEPVSPPWEGGVLSQLDDRAIKWILTINPKRVLYNDIFLCRTFRLFSGYVPPYHINNKVSGLLYTPQCLNKPIRNSGLSYCCYYGVLTCQTLSTRNRPRWLTIIKRIYAFAPTPLLRSILLFWAGERNRTVILCLEGRRTNRCATPAN